MRVPVSSTTSVDGGYSRLLYLRASYFLSAVQASSSLLRETTRQSRLFWVLSFLTYAQPSYPQTYGRI
jgi:hypothetical protein